MTAPDEIADSMKRRLRADLTDAMRARRTGEVKLLRVLLAALDNAEAVPVAANTPSYVVHAFGDGSAEAPRRRLTAAEVRSVLAREQAERQHSVEDFDRLGRADLALAGREDVALIRRYLDE